MTRIQTYTGRSFDYLDPSTWDFDILDIAHSLSQTCRFRGHTKFFYSVAQHCIECSFKASPKNKLLALMHEVGEAYCGDNPRPLKEAVPEIKYLEELILKTYCLKNDLLYPFPKEIKEIDNRMLATEYNILMSGGYINEEWSNFLDSVKIYPELSSIIFRPIKNAKEVEREFVSLYNKYSKEYKKMREKERSKLTTV